MKRKPLFFAVLMLASIAGTASRADLGDCIDENLQSGTYHVCKDEHDVLTCLSCGDSRNPGSCHFVTCPPDAH